MLSIPASHEPYNGYAPARRDQSGWSGAACSAWALTSHQHLQQDNTGLFKLTQYDKARQPQGVLLCKLKSMVQKMVL